MANLGFVGLGVMGGRIAKRLLDAGHKVTGHNRTRSRAEWLLDEGMGWADTPRAVAKAGDVVFTMVTDTAALHAVTEGPDGILAGLEPGKVYVDMSSISPAASRELAATVEATGARMLDAPVSGSVVTLEEGKLSIMVGGDEATFRDVEPILRDIARRNDGYLVHWGLAGNPRTPRDILERVAKDGDRVTAQQLAANPNTPLPILTRLVGSPEQFVRWGVAQNPSIDPAIMARLAADPDETVRFYLSFNRATTKEILERLARDPSERVRRYAGQGLERKTR